jgi:addiction module RelE/StbE family toxin
MEIKYHKTFLKNFRKRIKPHSKFSEQFKLRLNLLIQDSTNPTLKDHSLKGLKKGYRSFSVTGDIRVIYKYEGKNIRLYDIGTHNQVY